MAPNLIYTDSLNRLKGEEEIILACPPLWIYERLILVLLATLNRNRFTSLVLILHVDGQATCDVMLGRHLETK